jgi:hypothetical protein
MKKEQVLGDLLNREKKMLLFGKCLIWRRDKLKGNMKTLLSGTLGLLM